MVELAWKNDLIHLNIHLNYRQQLESFPTKAQNLPGAYHVAKGRPVFILPTGQTDPKCDPQQGLIPCSPSSSSKVISHIMVGEMRQ